MSHRIVNVQNGLRGDRHPPNKKAKRNAAPEDKVTLDEKVTVDKAGR